MPYVPQTIAQIQANIIAQKQSQPALNGLTSTSKVAYWNLWTFIFAVASSLLQQIWAGLVDEIETDVAKAVPGTALWIQSEVLKFQDGDVVQINSDFTISYPVIDTTKQIITAAAVVVGSSGSINVKVATGSPLAPISGTQLTELQAYLGAILPAGQVPNVISIAADTLQVNATIYYNGQFNSVIQANVIAALNSYMNLLPFNGLVRTSDIETTILSVDGVVDVSFTQITVGAIDLILASLILLRSTQTISGYLNNATAPNDFANTLTFIVAQQ